MILKNKDIAFSMTGSTDLAAEREFRKGFKFVIIINKLNNFMYLQVNDHTNVMCAVTDSVQRAT